MSSSYPPGVFAWPGDEDPSAPSLDELAEWIKDIDAHRHPVTPDDVQRAHRVGFSRASRLLEALEARGDLERIPGQLAWRATRRHQPAKVPAPAYSLPMSTREREALLRRLDGWVSAIDARGGRSVGGDLDTLRSLRDRLQRQALEGSR